MYFIITSVLTLLLIGCAVCEDRVMDIPIETYDRIIKNRCVSEVNFTSCDTKRHELYVSVKINSKKSEIINAECCLYREYLDCFDDALYMAGCKKEVFDELKIWIYDHFYNFETKCPSYERGSWNVIWLCPWPWYVWTIIALSINLALIGIAYCIFVSILRDRRKR